MKNAVFMQLADCSLKQILVDVKWIIAKVLNAKLAVKLAKSAGKSEEKISDELSKRKKQILEYMEKEYCIVQRRLQTVTINIKTQVFGVNSLK